MTTDTSEKALEALAVEAYRARRLSKAELRELLGFTTRHALDGFHKARDVYDAYTMADFEQERDAARRLGL